MRTTNKTSRGNGEHAFRARGLGRRLRDGAVLLLALVSVPVALAWAAPSGTMPVDVESGGSQGLQQPLRVNVWQDKEDGDIYRLGEQLRVYFETNRDAYAVVYRIDAEGDVTVLWPRSRFDDGFVFGQHRYTLPSSADRPLRVSNQEGVEYVEAVVSVYPFDLRALEVDFFNEDNDEGYQYRVAGDPFLAMNEVNYAMTGLEDPADYVVTNYTSYYVHQAVDHPRYLCGQCHDDDQNYDPYHDTCVINIHYDYGWYNRWWLTYGYYPVYYYPAFYYVDPWSWSPWVNYWYTPWYGWPVGIGYTWPYRYHVWCDSPYWHGDVWSRWKGGHRRYAPLAKDYVLRPDDRDVRYRRGSLMVRAERPGEDITRAMRTRTAFTDKEARRVQGVRAAGADHRYGNTELAVRTRTEFRGSTARPQAEPGLRIRDTGALLQGGSRTVRTVEDVRTGSDRVRIRDRSAAGQDSGERRLRAESSQLDKGTSDRRSGIRSVEPRKQGSRIWSGGRTTPTGESKARPQQVQPQDRNRRSSGDDSGSKVEPRRRSSSGSSRKSSGSVQPKKGAAGGSSSGSSGRSSGNVRSSSQPRSSAGSRSSAGRGRSSGGSSSSRGSSRGGGGSGRSGGGRSRG